jgi:hypothetical protein
MEGSWSGLYWVCFGAVTVTLGTFVTPGTWYVRLCSRPIMQMDEDILVREAHVSRETEGHEQMGEKGSNR